MLADTATAIVGSVSGFAAIGMMILAWVSWQDKKERDRQAVEIAEAQTEKAERIDLLAAGQTSIQAALARADAENLRLRGHIEILRREHASDLKAWQKKVEAQEDEIITLQGQFRQCSEDCRVLRQQLGRS